MVMVMVKVVMMMVIGYDDGDIGGVDDVDYNGDDGDGGGDDGGIYGDDDCEGYDGDDDNLHDEASRGVDKRFADGPGHQEDKKAWSSPT